MTLGIDIAAHGTPTPTEPGKPGAPAYTVFEFSAAQAGTSRRR